MNSLPLNKTEDFHRRRDGAVDARCHRAWVEKLGDAGDLLGEIEREPGEVLRKAGGQGVTSLREIAGEKFFCKVYRPDRLHRMLRDALMTPRAQMEWEANCRAGRRGVSSAIVVLAATRRDGPLRRTHLVVTAPAPGTAVDKLLRQDSASAEDRAALLRSLGGAMGRWHTLGFWHAHLHAKHVFALGADHFCLIDLERSEIHEHLPAPLAHRNLSQMATSLRKLGLSVTDCDPLFDGYAEECAALSPLREDRPALWRGRHGG